MLAMIFFFWFNYYYFFRLNPPLIDFHFPLPEKNDPHYTGREKQHRFAIGISEEEKIKQRRRKLNRGEIKCRRKATQAPYSALRTRIPED